MSNPRFGIYVSPLGMNWGTPTQNSSINGNSTNTRSDVSAIVDDVIGEIGSTSTYQFTDIFLWLIHYPSPSSPYGKSHPTYLTWNGTPFEGYTTPSGDEWGLTPGLPSKFKTLRDAGVNLLVSIGGWNGADNFAKIKQAGIRDFVIYLTEGILEPYNLNGINIDLEPGDEGPGWSAVYQEYGQTIVDLSNALAAKGYVVTHTPANGLSTQFYSQSCPGLANDQPILEATYVNGKQSISYLNVQYYAGGDPLGTSTGVQDYIALANTLAGIQNSTGVNNPAEFLMAGFSPCIQDPNYPSGSEPLSGTPPQSASCPSQTVVLDFLQQLATTYSGGFGGAFYWIYQYYNAQQAGKANQASAWEQMASAIGQS